MGKELELKISLLLRWGVVLSGLLLSAGWIGNLLEKGEQLHQFSIYKPQNLVESLHWIILTRDKASLFSYVGIFVLILLPLIRVLLTGVLFVRDKDYPLALFSFIVFGLLVLGIQLGWHI